MFCFSSMNLKCPYCGCCYEINNGILKEPIGNEKLGYGWWLRCCKCHKKWWLKHSLVEESENTPLKADKQKKIKKISSLTKNNKKPKPQNPNIKKIWKYLILATLICAVGLGYQYRTTFYGYLVNKAKRLSENVANKIVMTDVKYTIENNMVNISGNIANDDERIISKINGVKISVLDGKNEVLSWNTEFDGMNILPQQKIPFSSSKKLPENVKDMHIEVSIF